MASAIAAARQRINDVGAEGDLDGAGTHGEIELDRAIETRRGEPSTATRRCPAARPRRSSRSATSTLANGCGPHARRFAAYRRARPRRSAYVIAVIPPCGR